MDQYRNKIIIAPMVRVSSLPFRLLCLDYGADLVYTEETIDFKMLRSQIVKNDLLNTTDFVDKSDGTVYFRTCEKERSKVVFQMGTSNPQRALKVAKLVEEYVAGIDINMGCPKEFSIKGGMGAALLTQPDKIKAILTTLTANLSIPVTCKIRILPSLEDTLELCRMIETCGVAALAVHGRTRTERPNHANHNDVIKVIAEALKIPVIANGGSKGMENLEDIEKFRSETGSSSVMVARAAMWNCSLLRKGGPLPVDSVIKEYLRLCVLYDNAFTYTKYTVQNMLRDRQCTERGRAFLETQTLQELCTVWDLKHFFLENVTQKSSSAESFSRSLAPQSLDDVAVQTTVEEGAKVVQMAVQFIRGNYGPADLPKMILHNYSLKNGSKGPSYECKSIDKYFVSDVLLDGVKYRSLVKEKNKRYSEQGSALVCLHALGLVGRTFGFVPSIGTRKHANFTSSLDSISVEDTENERPSNEPLLKRSKVVQNTDSEIIL